MATCSTCGNDYALAFSVTTAGGESYTFDSIECAAQKIAPTCEVCGVRILGHGMQAGDRMFCCDNCARKAGVEGLNDRV
jgi:hypothetical protein